MRPILFILTLLFLAACSDDTAGQKEQPGAKDHIMRSQIDTMNRAKEVRSLVQERLDEEQQKSEEIAK